MGNHGPIVEYNGVVLSVLRHKAHHAYVQGEDRYNWEVSFRTGGIDNPGVRRRLLENGHLLFGLLRDMSAKKEFPLKVISQCRLDLLKGEWAFWAVEATEEEVANQQIKEIAIGGMLRT